MNVVFILCFFDKIFDFVRVRQSLRDYLRLDIGNQFFNGRLRYAFVFLFIGNYGIQAPIKAAVPEITEGAAT